jgi:hypothetical protein
MKRLFFTVFIALGLMALPARAQLGYAVANPVLSGGTNNVLNAATNSYIGASGNVLDVRYQTAVTCETTFVGSGAGTGNQTYYFDQSIDRVGWWPYTNFNVAFNGTTGVTNGFTFSVNGVGFLRLNSLGNTNTIRGTNEFFQYAIKKGL